MINTIKALKTIFLIWLTMNVVAVEAIAQENPETILNGVIRNSNTNEPVPYATLNIKGTIVGVVANDKGQFEFPLDVKYLNDTIEVRAVGFDNLYKSVNDVRKNNGTIMLNEASLVLSEVLVTDVSPKDIIIKALKKYDENFSSDPYEMEVYYRTTLKENDQYVKLLECLFNAYDKGFNYPKIDKSVDIQYLEIRKSDVYTNKRTKLPEPFFKPQWLLTVENYARKKDELLSNLEQSLYDIEMDTSSYLNNELIYIIEANAKESVDKFLFSIKFFIRASDYSVFQMDFDAKEKVKYLTPSGIPGSLKLDIKGFKATYIFKEYKGNMYMSYLNNYATYDWYDNSSNELINSNEENTQALIQNITIPEDGKSTLVRPANRKARSLPIIPYRVKSWASSELVKQLPYDSKITTDLESKGRKLEEQFKSNVTQ